MRKDLLKKSNIKCASIHGKDYYVSPSEFRPCTLIINFTDSEYKDFIEALDYNLGLDLYGEDELVGTIWLKDGSWYSIEFIDGCHYFFHHFESEKKEMPVIYPFFTIRGL